MAFYGEGVKFIAGKDFDSEYGHHVGGTEVKEAKKFQNLDVLVSTGWLYPYVPTEGYDHLPPHIFDLVRTFEETKAILDGDRSGVEMRQAQHPAGKPDAVVEAERQVAADQEGRDLSEQHALAVKQVRAKMRGEEFSQPLDEQQEKRATAKKAAAAPQKTAQPTKTAEPAKKAAPAATKAAPAAQQKGK